MDLRTINTGSNPAGHVMYRTSANEWTGTPLPVSYMFLTRFMM